MLWGFEVQFREVTVNDERGVLPGLVSFGSAAFFFGLCFALCFAFTLGMCVRVLSSLKAYSCMQLF